MLETWFKINDKIRFLIIGGFNFSVSYIIYSSFCLFMGVNFYQIALVLAWIFSSIISFTTQKHLVFRGKGIWYKEYLKCCSTWVISYIINAIALEVIVKHVLSNVFIAQVIATFISAIFTYILFKNFAFKNR